MAAERAFGEPITERGRATRQALLDAAEAVFDEYSFDRASISEITRRAGVAQGTFYLYFSDKRAVFVELVETLSHGLRSAIAEAVEGAADRVEVERIGFDVFFDYITRHRGFYKLVRESEFVDPDVFHSYYDHFLKGYVPGLAEAIERGEIAGDLDPEVLAFCLMGIGEIIGLRYVVWQDGRPLDRRIAEQVWRFMLRGLGVPEEGTD
ncbi:MAG: TetR/AcrR family transcriptional regulator [Actinobacteria bacterium]|nr:TetR/AcrR family transcriptional regulator [Actinomycetota bacterium]